MIANAPKRKETHQNLSLRSNGVDREHLLRKIPTRLRGMNFCINCTSLGSNGVDREHLLRKTQAKHRGSNCCINCTSLSRFASSFV